MSRYRELEGSAPLNNAEVTGSHHQVRVTVHGLPNMEWFPRGKNGSLSSQNSLVQYRFINCNKYNSPTPDVKNSRNRKQCWGKGESMQQPTVLSAPTSPQT